MSRPALKTLFFSPVFNQIHELPTLLAELTALAPLPCDRFLFVDNGSSDGSERLLEAAGYPVLRVPRNRGVGFAIMLAADYALEHGFDVVGGLASNGKMLPAEMHRVLEPIARGEADYVTGSRFLDGGDSPNLPSFRKNTIPMVNHFVRALYGRRLTDATCGYRAYRTDLLRRAQFDWHAPSLWTYGLEYYLYGKVLLAGSIPWVEVPITMRYPEKGKRYSKIRPGRDWVAMLEPWVRARFDRTGFEPA